MQLKIWKPFFDLDRDWPPFDFPKELMSEFTFRPSIDLVKKDGEMVVTAELPGMNPEDVDIEIDDDVLVIRGEKTEERIVDEDDRYLRERSFGKFQRRIALPAGVDADKITAAYDKGVLTVSVQLPTEAKPEAKRVPITTK